MPVIGPERYSFTASLVFLHQCLHHRIHVHVAVQVVCLVKATLAVFLYVAKVREIHPRLHGVEDIWEVIALTGPKRPGTKAYPVERPIERTDNVQQVFFVARDTWQPEDRIWRVVGMDGHPDTFFLTDLGDVRQKPNQVFAQAVEADGRILPDA